MTEYNGDLVVGHDSDADHQVQELTHEYTELQDVQLDLEEDDLEYVVIGERMDEIYTEIENLRS